MKHLGRMVNERGIIFVAFLIFGSPTFQCLAGSETGYKSKYIGQEKREIKSLSFRDIEELRAGDGWGLAKAAELNGLPGPKHILEMRQEIGLTSHQENRIKQVYKQMKKQAVGLGNELIELERELNHHFATGTIDEKKLKDLLDRIADTYKELRFVHLSAHLKTPDILSQSQIKEYNKLRGYTSDDPCENVPKGHNAEMWKRHHNCP